MNRGRLEVDYSLQNPKWAIYSSVSPTSTTTNGKIAWKLTVKNNGYCASENVTLSLPKGVTVASSTGKGTYNNTNKTWSIPTTCKNGSVTRTFYLKSSSVGNKTLTATQSSSYVVNKKITDTAIFNEYIPPIQPQEHIYFTFYETYAKEPSYFDITINGVHNGLETHCYEINIPNGLTVSYPLASSMIDLNSNENVKRFVNNTTKCFNKLMPYNDGETTFDYSCFYYIADFEDGEMDFIITDNNKICLKVENVYDDFEAHLRIPVRASSDNDYTITVHSDDSNKDYDGVLEVLEERGLAMIVDGDVSRDKTYVPNSVNIGVPNIWTVRANVSRNNFFDEKKESMEISIEDRIAYIGVIPLSRCHKADVTADSKNSLIENRYLNRAYYGKKGDYSEDIKMTLRIPWYDVATLQGLCEMDKPIPIDTIPTRQDGDPLNHRGWAEIYEVTNIKKINDMLYECDVGVKYLSHDINTRFTITEAKKITEATIKYYLALVHDYNMDLLDIFKLNYYEFWTTLEDANGDKIGSYDIDPNTTLILNRDLNKHSTYDIVFRNTVPVLQSEDYDGNFELALKVINKDDNNVLFEHDYNNFKHYNFDTQYAENTTDATTKYLNGTNYETLNFEKIGLGYDELSPLIEDMKVATHFNTKETVHITDPTEQFEIFLLDAYNKGIENATVNVRITGSDNFTTTFNCITDLYGRIFFNVDWGNGDYTVTLNFFENEKYRACTYSVGLEVELEYIQYHFTYPSNQQFIGSNSNFVCTLLDDNDNPVSNNILHYSFKDIGSDEYEHEETVTTDVDGRATIPIQRMNGSQMIRVNFKGYSNNGTVYQPVQFEEQINVTNLTLSELLVEADDLTMIQGDFEKEYSVIVKNKDTGSVVQDLDIDFYLYDKDESYHLSATTNDYGVASVPIYLKGGAWKVDVCYGGDETYNPYVITKDIIIENSTQLSKYIQSENLTLNENKILDGSQDYYTIHLYDENGNGIVNEPVSVIIYDANLVGSTEQNPYVDTVLCTDENGKVGVPYIGHNEQVIIKANYYGSVGFTGCNNVDLVTFENIEPKVVQSFTKVTETVIEYGTGEEKEEDSFALYKGSSLQNNWVSDVCIVTSADKPRLTSYVPIFIEKLDEEVYPYSDMISNKQLPKGEYKVTVLKKGDENNYSICRTFTLRRVNDTRPNFNYYCYMQGLEYGGEDWELTMENLTPQNSKVGDFAHIRFKSNVWLPTNTLVTIKSGSEDGYNPPIVYDTEYKTIIKDYYDEDGKLLSYFDCYGILTSEPTWYFAFENTYNCKALWYEEEITANSSSKTPITVTQTGFAYNNETHQDINITISDNNNVIYYTNGYYIIKAFNLETNEEKYYYSYINDNLKPSEIQFDLTKTVYNQPNWQLEIFVNNSDTYKGGYYTTTGLITTSTVINTDTILPIFADGNSYIEDGTSQLTFGDNGFSFETQGGK